MSAKTGEHTSEESYATKLGIAIVGTKKFLEMIQLYADTPRAVICGIGKPGIGKSQVAKQAARARNDGKGVPFMCLHVPQMSVEDFYIPTSATDSKEYYDKRIPRKFQALLEYCKETQTIRADEEARKVPKEKRQLRENPLLIIEEPNRANDKNVTKALFTIVEDRYIGDTKLPEEVQIVMLMNPSEGGNQVNEFEKDPAYRRRLLFVGVRMGYAEFIQHAANVKFHDNVVAFLQAQTKWVYDEAAQAVGKVYANPAAWETVSDICKTLDLQQRPLTGPFAVDSFSGKIGRAATEAFVSYMKDSSAVISGQDVLEEYKEKSKIRDRVLKMVHEGRNGVMIDLCQELATYLFDGKERDPKKFSKQLALFMNDLGQEQLVDFISYKLSTASENVDGGRAYLEKLSTLFSQEPEFQKAMGKYQEAMRKSELAKNMKA